MCAAPAKVPTQALLLVGLGESPDLKTSLSIFARTQASQLRFWLQQTSKITQTQQPGMFKASAQVR